MTSLKRQWIVDLLLWPNLAVAVLVVILVSVNQISSARQLGQTLAYALTYANLTSILAALLFSSLAGKLKPRKVPVFLLCVFVAVPLGTLIAQTLLWVFGFQMSQSFWPLYLRTIRVCVPLSILLGSLAFAYVSLRERMHATEEKLRQKELAEERAQKLVAEARLHSLESRIHPHFLFNTLNSISSLIPVNPARAEQLVGRLAILLRASLDNSNQPLIPLRQELAMVESYMEIEKARFGDKLRSSIEAPAELLNTTVPPMSVQGLVENAVKHGISSQSGGGEIVIAASTENGNLRIEIRDTGPGFDLSAVQPGHGLDNLVERLDALFGSKARLNVLHRDGYSVVEMVLPRV